MKKTEIIEITLTEKANLEKSIGYYEDKKVMVNGGLIRQRVEVFITKVRKNRAEGVIKRVIEKAPNEIEASCPNFGICGGCMFQNLSYENQLKQKEDYIKGLFEKAEIDYGEFMGITASPMQHEYRNKMEFSFGDMQKGGELTLGMHEKGKHHNIVSVKECMLVDEDYRKILALAEEFYREKQVSYYNKYSKSGVLRHLVIKKAYYTKEILVNLVTTSQGDAYIDELKDKLLKITLEGKLKSFLHTTNDSFSDAVIAQKVDLIYGEEFITEKCLGLTFKIGAFSFFQTNTLGAEKLYSIVNEFTGNKENKNIFDLYCGTGTIAQIVSKNAKKVYGIEIVPQAIEAAKENARINNINNCEFICADVLNEVENLKSEADIIILDPPRAGIHPKAINKILSFEPETFVYVSCKASSFIAEVPFFLNAGYKIEKCAVVDLFPNTPHVETVCLMSKKEK